MRQTSEFFPYTGRQLLVRSICRVLLPLVMLRCREFWGLRQFALKHCRGILGGLARNLYYLYLERFGADIPLSVQMDGPPCLPHGVFGIFMGAFTHIGKNVTILQQVTIGEDTFSPKKANARRYIGDGTFIGAGAKIIGGCVIGKNCRIGANACVYSDMPDNTVAVMQPTRLIQKVALDNRFRRDSLYFEDGLWLTEFEDK